MKMKNKQSLFSLGTLALLILTTSTISLAQTDFHGALKSVSISDSKATNAPPTSVIAYSNNGDIYSFDASQSTDADGSIVEYKWDFGDGRTATGVTANHQFTGTPIPISLTIVDDAGGVAISQLILSVFTETFDIIADDADSTIFNSVGDWTESTIASGYYNVGYKTAAAGMGSSEVMWTLTIPVNGSYEIFCYYTAHDNRASNAPYTITNNDQEIGKILVNQKINGRIFYSLGTYSLSKGKLDITLSNTGDGYAIADAVKITYMP